MTPRATTEPPIDSHFRRPIFCYSTGRPYWGGAQPVSVVPA
jgi:hypothetical protein